MNLLLDIGNTRLKWVPEQATQLGQMMALDYRQPGFYSNLQQHWQTLETPATIAIASVSNKQLLQELIQLSQSLWPDSRLLIAQSASFAYGVKNAYLQAEKLGVDRWLALIAARKHYFGNVCVVDCGTAITVDVLQEDGTHLGGLICPGLRLMKNVLTTHTADLNFTHQIYKTELAAATDTAIANGVFLAAIGLIEHVVQKLDRPVRLVLTGGDASSLAEAVTVAAVVDHALVLKGLSIVCQGE